MAYREKLQIGKQGDKLTDKEKTKIQRFLKQKRKPKPVQKRTF